jgi:hypothetical protein
MPVDSSDPRTPEWGTTWSFFKTNRRTGEWIGLAIQRAAAVLGARSLLGLERAREDQGYKPWSSPTLYGLGFSENRRPDRGSELKFL